MALRLFVANEGVRYYKSTAELTVLWILNRQDSSNIQRYAEERRRIQAAHLEIYRAEVQLDRVHRDLSWFDRHQHLVLAVGNTNIAN